MKKYYGMLAAAAVTAAVLLSACSGKSDGPATEKTRENTEAVTQTESGTREPVIQIVEETETQAAVKPEDGAQGSTQGGDAESQLQKVTDGKTADAGTKAAAGGDAVKKTEPARVYSVKAFESTMYATASVNVRASYTTGSEVLTSLSPGQKVKVTGKSENGWIRVIYDGRDAFVYQKYLSDSAPQKKAETEEKKQPESQPSQPGVTTYPGNQAEDPVKTPGEIPIVEPAPINTSPGQSSFGSSVTEYGPGVGTPGNGNSQAEPGTPGFGPGM